MRISDWSSDVCSSDLLPDDLARAEVADEAHRARMAETAIEGAADLARYAERSPIGVGDEHHLIFLPVGGGEQPFARAVARHLRLAHRRAADDAPVGQPGAPLLCVVGHPLAIGKLRRVRGRE